jgi:hypothetical protein
MLLSFVMEQTSNFVLICGKTAKEHTQCLKLLIEMKLYLVCMFWNGLKVSEGSKRTLNTIQGQGSHQVL